MEFQIPNLKEALFIDDTILKEPIFTSVSGEEDSVICSTQVSLSPGKARKWNLCHARDHELFNLFLLAASAKTFSNI